MAKITVEGQVYEGTPEELREIFEMMGVKFPVEEKPSEIIYRQVHRSPKLGDYLLFAEGTARYIEDGKYYEVDDVDNEGEAWVIDEDGDSFYSYTEKYEVYEKLSATTEEEVAQAKAELERKQAEDELHEKWAKIGRKPNEFKKGDIVRVIDVGSSRHEVGDIGEITEFDGDGFRVNTHRISRVNWLNANLVELIAPVESCFDEAK